MKKISIAIDGPSAAGKSTIAKIIAKKLDYVYIDTGAMYRCVGYYCLNNDVDLDDETAVSKALKDIKIEMDSANQVYLNQINVSQDIRKDEISMAASVISKYQPVRDFLVKQQRQMASLGGVILDGRDIGTVVLPNADLKIYQVASSKTRAKRRYLENLERGLEADLQTIQEEIEERDYQDMHRQISPLKKADDAIEIDTSDLTLDQVVEKVMELIIVKQKEE
ncbi:(d)CMP kinase [Thomasclavelia sp.]|uniref:(d)CMP kinase n=1 Tax=Thomasclavelia sp. TaxID=3025757 RepID=UPI0025D5F0A7|nr:(d)CMP kinase [Thomasclavelia sp.]